MCTVRGQQEHLILLEDGNLERGPIEFELNNRAIFVTREGEKLFSPKSKHETTRAQTSRLTSSAEERKREVTTNK